MAPWAYDQRDFVGELYHRLGEQISVSVPQPLVGERWNALLKRNQSGFIV